LGESAGAFKKNGVKRNELVHSLGKSGEKSKRKKTFFRKKGPSSQKKKGLEIV
jgi:hypothetical protein